MSETSVGDNLPEGDQLFPLELLLGPMEYLHTQDYMAIVRNERARFKAEVIIQYRCVACQGDLVRTNLVHSSGPTDYQWNGPLNTHCFPMRHECLGCGAVFETDKKGRIVHSEVRIVYSKKQEKKQRKGVRHFIRPTLRLRGEGKQRLTAMCINATEGTTGSVERDWGRARVAEAAICDAVPKLYEKAAEKLRLEQWAPPTIEFLQVGRGV